MKPIKQTGFTLVELMITVVLVAILAVVTVPTIMGVLRRNHLTDLANEVEQSFANARALAIKSRRAVVVEVRRNGQVWVNQLATAACDADITGRCVELKSTTLANNMLFFDGSANADNGYTSAGVAMCDFRVASLDGSNNCVINTIAAAAGAGICYSGSGRMWIRRSIDANTGCAATTQPGAATWERSCIPYANTTNADANNNFSGVDLGFNRFEGAAGECAADGTLSGKILGVTRRVVVPAGGHPYVR